MVLSEIIRSSILLLSLAIVASLFWHEKKTKVPAIPTLPWVRRKMIEGLRRYADREKPYRIADLGSGWGGLSFKLSAVFPQATVVGYELATLPYWVSKIRGLISCKKINFHQRDFFKQDLSQFDIVICYLQPWHMPLLKPQLEQLKAGSIILVNAFPVPGWEPIETQYTDFVVKIPIYVYRR